MTENPNPKNPPPSVNFESSEAETASCVASDQSGSGGEEYNEFHIVGVGASAGGLDALEKLFAALPSDSGIAFVVVQHLSPDFKSHMEQLLARHTSMAIYRVENGMQVAPNSIYLIPPKVDMIISGGKLLLTDKGKEGSLSHPIDQFFRSLASDIGRYAAGVVLSGTGSDGSRGIRDIHDAGGLVLAQDVSSAKFDGMPMNAQSTGCVDLVLPPQGIAEAIVRYVKEGLTPEAMATDELLAHTNEGVDRVFQLLNTQHDLDFSYYKATTVSRRIQRRISLLHLDNVQQYLSRLEEDPAELNDLYKDLLIGVTRFFRNPEAFQFLEKHAIPKLLDRLKRDAPIRVWAAGCATGEEAYSLAILFDEALRRRRERREIKIFATDAHHVSLHAAARGVFSEETLNEMDKKRRHQYFSERRDGYHVSKELRRLVVFAPHNVIRDAPFTQMDMVSCRNLLIYLRPVAQKKAISMFHFALKASGILFLGPSESPGEIKDEFTEIDKRWRIYSKRRDIRLPVTHNLPIGSPSEKESGRSDAPPTRESRKTEHDLLRTYDRLLDRKMPPSFLINENYEMLHTFGGAERFLNMKAGRPSLKLTELIHDSLRTALTGAVQHALRKNDIVKYTGLSIATDQGRENITLTVEPIHDDDSQPSSLLVEIESAETPIETLSPPENVDMSAITQQRVASLESELRYSQENLQATVEEMETTNEELQATNEELVASNEELQSTNEELHSVNEELYTVNTENQRRIEEINRANDDMDNLLATTRVGVIFLDSDLYIRRFTPEIARMFHLISHDIGRSIEVFTHNLKHDSLADDLREVLEHQREKELRVFDRNDLPFILRMMPYRSDKDKIKGVVMTLIDISALYRTQGNLEQFKFMVESAADGMVLADFNGDICYANPVFCSSLGYTRDELMNMSVMDIDPLYDKRRFREVFEEAIENQIASIETEHRRKDGSIFPVEVTINGVELRGQSFLFANVRDITNRVERNKMMRLHHLAIRATMNGVCITDPSQDDNPIIYANPGFLKLTGFAEHEVLGRNCRLLQGDAHDQSEIETIRAAVENEQPCRVTIQNYRHDGTLFWNDLQITPVHDDHGRLVNFVGVQSDVTSQREIQNQLQETNERYAKLAARLKDSEKTAKQANAAKSRFLANISHELRTPMTSVIGFADMLDNQLDDPISKERVQTIKRNSQYLLSLLNDLLDLSKIEADKLEIVGDEINLLDVLRDVRSLMDVRASSEGVPLSFNFTSAIPTKITADRLRIRQILVNLISNALKFTDEGSVTVETELTDDEERRLNIHVRDTGIGISEEDISHIFEAFTQSESSRKSGGSGLGLAISKRLAEAMHASILVESELGVGSRFTLSLPTTDQQCETLIEADIESSRQEDSTQPLPHMDARVLVVDDRRDVWRVSKYFLERCGASVEIAEDGQQAVDAVERAIADRNPFDLILMDMQMPVMNGREAVEELRRREVKTPVIAMTADAMDGERERCLEFGCDDYFPKPIDGPQLMSLCAKVIEGSKTGG
jgi:two-component system CheB/CheR fusion protein